MYKKFFLMGAVLFGALCSTAFGGFEAEPQTPPKMYAPVQDVNQFDVSGEIAALKQAKAEMVKAHEACGDDDQKYQEATTQFVAKEKKIFDGLANRRRDQYAKVHFEVTRHGRAWAKAKRTPWDGHRYCNGDYRIDCPNPAELILIPGSCRWIEHSRKDNNGGGGRIENPREENNGYTVHYWIKGPDIGYRDSHLDFTMVALYRYNDATVTKLVNADMVTLRKRVEDGAK